MKVTARPSFDQLVASLDRHHARLCADMADLLETVSYLDLSESWGDDETSLECFLSARYSVSAGTAYEWVRVSRALRVLPATSEAFASGHISWDQLRPLTKFATPESDERWALEAPRTRVGKLWREAQRHERARQQREMTSHRQARNFHMEWNEDKTLLHVDGTFDAQAGAALQGAVERRAAEVVLEEDDPPFDPKGARQADALEELVTSSSGEASPPTLVVHTDAAVLAASVDAKPETGSPTLAETESGAQLMDDAVRELACNARVEWVLESEGRAVGIGRQSRTVPGWLGRQLRHRDPECRFDGCSRRSALIAHHIVHWARGGPTDLGNLVRLCKTHHRLVHECGWTIRGHPDRRLTFHRPRERTARLSRAPALIAASFP
ncbi:MAG: DUF222 domain-containing protein [Actinomycetota bacterium]